MDPAYCKSIIQKNCKNGDGKMTFEDFVFMVVPNDYTIEKSMIDEVNNKNKHLMNFDKTPDISPKSPKNQMEFSLN